MVQTITPPTRWLATSFLGQVVITQTTHQPYVITVFIIRILVLSKRTIQTHVLSKTTLLTHKTLATTFQDLTVLVEALQGLPHSVSYLSMGTPRVTAKPVTLAIFA